MSKVISEYYSEDGLKHAMVISRTYGGYRLVMIDSYFETENELMFNHQEAAEEYAENWVLNK